MSQSSRSMVSAAALLAAVGGLGGPLGGFGLRLPHSRGNKYLPPAPNVPTPPQPPSVKGGGRNEICNCGCGRKRKKCPKGASNIPPKAHDLQVGEYTDEVGDILLREYDEAVFDHVMRHYVTSHIHSYCRDEVITPEMCARLCKDQYDHDQKLLADQPRGEDAGPPVPPPDEPLRLPESDDAGPAQCDAA